MNRFISFDDVSCFNLLVRLAQVMEWISNKQQVATDESYSDPTNLSNKIQRHQAFEAELAANKRRLDAVVAEGNELSSGGHYATKDINARLAALEQAWQNLVESSQDKSVKLAQAYQALQFNRQCDDLERWLDDVEGQLASEDHGRDIATVQALLKRHQVRAT